MSDVTNNVSSNVFKSFGATTKKNSLVEKKLQETANTTQIAVQEEKPKNTKLKLEKAMPYVATGASVVAVGVAAVAMKKSSKNSKEVLKKITELEKALTENKVTTPAAPENLKNATSFLVGILGAATGGAIVNHFDTNRDTLKKLGMTDDEINSSKNKVSSAAYERENKVNRVENTANEAINKANEAKGQAQSAENRANEVNGKADQAINTSNEAINRANAASGQNGIALAIHRKPYYGLNLMVVNNHQKYVNQEKFDKALEDIHTAVIYRNGRVPGQTEQIVSDYRKKYVPLMQSNSTWAITAEFDPIKAGGLGSVPMEIQNNFADMGIENPVFIPMYQDKGNAEFFEYGKGDNKKYSYKYGGELFELEKMAEMPVTQYRGAKVETQNVEFYLGHVKRKDINGNAFANPKQPIVFVKNTNNFNGGIYTNGFNADEPEKFAFLSKAVYQLAEAKVSQALGKDKTGLGELKIINKEAYDEVKAPVAMMLNDWHAAPMAGLLRYKAPMECAYNAIPEDVRDALRDMPLVMIGHNAGIPGGSRNHSIERSDMVTENIINTLYDSYALAITENANTGREHDSVSNSILWDRSDINNRRFNNLAHGIALSDYYVPVSTNYQKELVEGRQDSDIAFDILNARKDTGSIIGEVNGLDRDLNTTEAKAGWLKNAFGMNIKTYNHHTPIDEVMNARQHNKMELFDNYVTPIKDGARKLGGKDFEVIGNPMNVSREDFEKAPLLCFAHRLTDQKGLDVFQVAVQELFNSWDEKHPGQPKPVIIAGGQLEEEAQKPFLDALKNPDNYNNKDDVNRILVLKGFMPNPALYAAATYFNAPSRFEPCGLTQGECYAMGTPVIATATGGFVDTIKDQVNGFVVSKTVNCDGEQKGKEIDIESFFTAVKGGKKSYGAWKYEVGKALADKMDEGLNVYFNDKDKYKAIVQNNLNENLSWNRGSNNDPIHGYMRRLAINKDDNIEANVAPVRKYIAPILKQFDLLKAGKIDNKTFEKNTKVLDIANNETNATQRHNGVFDKFNKQNSRSIDDINQNLKKITDYQFKVDTDEKSTQDKKQNKLDIANLKIAMENDKLDTLKTSAQVVQHDKQMLDRFIEMYQKDKHIDLNAEEHKDLNNWKKEIVSRYAA